MKRKNKALIIGLAGVSLGLLFGYIPLILFSFGALIYYVVLLLRKTKEDEGS